MSRIWGIQIFVSSVITLSILMKKNTQKEISFRRLYNQQELSHIILKSIVKNQNLFLNEKWNAIPKLSNWARTYEKARFVSRCTLTNQKAKFNRIFKKFSVLSFLLLARSGVIPGFKKYLIISWNLWNQEFFKINLFKY